MTASRLSTRQWFNPFNLLSSIRVAWKIVLIIALVAVGAIGASLTAWQGLQLLRFHLSNIYDFMLVPIVIINQADVSLVQAQLQLEVLKNTELTSAQQAAALQTIASAENNVTATIGRYDTEWVTTISPEFTVVLRDAGRLDLQEDEVATLAQLHTAYDTYRASRVSFQSSIEAGTPDIALADQTNTALVETHNQLRHLIDINNQFADLSNQAAVAAFEQTLINIVVTVSVSLLLGLILAIVIARSITGRLGTLAQAAQNLQAGRFEQTSTVEGNDEIGTLGTAFTTMTAQLQNLVGSLEQRVTERTRDLALAAQVGRSVSQVRDLDSLLAEAVETIRANFDLYYTQIYLVDSAGNALIMQVGTGGVGAELKRRAFRLPIGSGSLNGTAAATRQAVLVADTTLSSTFRPNPLLPNTRSELAVPLLVGDKVIGVLDLQSSRPNTFSEDNKQAFDVLAGQLATSIQNNRLFSEAEASRAELEQQASRLARSGWENFLDGIHNQEVIQAAYVAEDPTGLGNTLQPKPQVISAPITIVGEEVGSLSLETSRALSESETQLVSAVAAQVARQIESVRLLAQAEQYRNEAEQTVRRYTREGWLAYTASDESAGSFEYNGNRVMPVPANAPKAHADLVKPITVRGETIGEINLDGLTVVDEQAVQLLEAVSNQLSTHIESLRLAEQTQSALAQTETLYDITGQLTAANNITEVLQIIAKVKNATRMTLMTIDSNPSGQPETVSIAAYWPENTTGALPIGTHLTLAQFPTARHWVDHPDEPILFYEDMATDPNLDEYTREFNLKRGIRGAIYMALQLGSQWIGLIGISWSTPQQLTQSDRQLYQAMASQAAVVINNRLLFEQTQKRGERESIINVISQRIQSTTTVADALEAATREIGNLLKAKRALVEIGNLPTNGGSEHS